MLSYPESLRLAKVARVRNISIRLANAFLERRWLNYNATIVDKVAMRHKGRIIATHVDGGWQLGFNGMLEETVADRLNAIMYLAAGATGAFSIDIEHGGKRKNYGVPVAYFGGGDPISAKAVFRVFDTMAITSNPPR